MLGDLKTRGFVGGAALLVLYAVMVIAEIAEGGRINRAVGPMVLLVVLINPRFWVFAGLASLLAIWLFAAVRKRGVDRR